MGLKLDTSLADRPFRIGIMFENFHADGIIPRLRHLLKRFLSDKHV